MKLLFLLIKLMRSLAFMTVPPVNPNQQLLATDTNVHIAQTNTNTTGIASNTSNISTNSSDIANLKSTPTVSGLATFNGNPTGITVAHAATVSGTLNVPGTLNGNTIQFAAGQITRMSIFSGSANNSGTLQAHGLGVKPDFVMIMLVESNGDTNTFSWDQANSDATNIKVWTLNATARNYIALAIKT